MDDNELDKLMKIATSSNKPIKHDNPEVLRFIEECGIKSGTKKIYTFMLYYRYYQWSDNKKKVLGRTAFFKETVKHFDRKRDVDGNVYLLNEEPFDLSTDGYFAARALMRREKHVREQKKESNKKK